MGAGRELAADPGNVLRMDEVEAGVGPQKTSQPEPLAGVHQPFGEIARGERAATINTTAEHQGRKHRDNLFGQRMLLQLFQALSLGLDVFGAVGEGFGEWLQVAIENARRGEIGDLLDQIRIEQGQHPFHRYHIYLLRSLGVTPGCGGVDHPGHGGQIAGETVGFPQIAHQQPHPGVIGLDGREFGRIPQPKEEIRIAVL